MAGISKFPKQTLAVVVEVVGSKEEEEEEEEVLEAVAEEGDIVVEVGSKN